MHLKQQIKAFVRNRINNRRFNSAAINQSKSEAKAANKMNLPPLTTEEKKQIHNMWGKFITNIELGYPGFQVYKSIYGFDANYLPFSYFYPWIIRVLNPIEYAHVFSNKCMSHLYFPNVKHPKLVARKVKNCIFSEMNQIISEDELIHEISQKEYNMIIKKSTDSCCGRNIEIIHKHKNENEIRHIIQSFKDDYIIQKIVTQSPEVATFNPTSLNTMRISTMFLNGKFTLCTAMIKFGQPNKFVDNISSGGCCVGINDDGTFMEYGFNNEYDKISEWNGVSFKNHKIPQFAKVIETAQKAHFCIPQCHFVGWDFAIDDNGEVILIEANLIWPGLFFAQLANGRPAFKGRELEVLEYVKSQPFPYGSAN